MNRGPGTRSSRRGTPHARLLRQLTGELRSVRERLDELTDQMTDQSSAPAGPAPEDLPLDDPGTGPLTSTDDVAIDLADGDTSDLLRRRAIVYARLRERLRTTLTRVIPEGATVLVVSRGDDELLAAPGRATRHFPATSDGTWAGYHPADSTAAIVLLEQQRATGADYLVIPAPSTWWLSHYAEFRAHLERSGRLVLHDDVGVIVALGTVIPSAPASLPQPLFVPLRAQTTAEDYA
jgi:hypothetical protein